MSIKRYDVGRWRDIGGEYSTNFVFEEDGRNAKESINGDYVLYRDHCELLARLMEKSMDGGWISVEDRLPDYDVPVLWLHASGVIFVADIDHDSDWEFFKRTYECTWDPLGGPDVHDPITHWRAAPPLPEHTPREPLDRSSL